MLHDAVNPGQRNLRLREKREPAPPQGSLFPGNGRPAVTTILGILRSIAPAAHRRWVEAHHGPARDPLDIPRRGRGPPVQCRHRTAPEPEPGHLDHPGQPGPDRSAWAVTASPHTPTALLADLCESLAHETGTRAALPGREHKPRLTASAPAGPPVTADPLDVHADHPPARGATQLRDRQRGQTGDPAPHRRPPPPPGRTSKGPRPDRRHNTRHSPPGASRWHSIRPSRSSPGRGLAPASRPSVNGAGPRDHPSRGVRARTRPG